MASLERPDRWIGEILRGRYRVVEKLAEGGMGAVYRAERLEGGGAVAVKILHAHLARDHEVVTRFRREALAAAAIGDAHIVEVIELDELDDQSGVFMAMELLEGKDLGQVLREDAPLTIARVVDIARQIAGALDRAHALGIVHRDLKPENVFLVTREGRTDFVKVLDFGVSKLLAAIEGAEPSATKTGTTLGTPHYMAPEQAQAKKTIDHRVDVYALGVILFRALTGQHPFEDDSLPLLIVKICVDPPPSVQAWRADVPPSLAAVIERMLQKAPEDRFASMAEAAEALAPFAELHAAPALRDAPPTRDTTPSALEKRRTPEAFAPTRRMSGAEHDEDAPPPPPENASLGVAKIAAALMGIALLALVGWAIAGALEDEPIEDEPPLPALPTPAAPRTQAMIATGSGYGWTWVNPRPRSMPTWYAVDAAAGGERVVLAGWAGQAVRYERGSLFVWPTGTDAALRGVAWTGTSEAIAVGEGGVIVRLAGDGHAALESGVDVTLRDAVAVSATEAVVVGDGGTMLRVTADRVTRLDVGTGADLMAAFARGAEVFVVGAEGTVLRVENREVVRERVGVSTILRGIGGCPNGEIYAAGDRGVLLRRRRSGEWSRVRVSGPARFTSVACDHGRVAATREDGEVLLVSGAETVRMPTGFEGVWHAVSGNVEGPSWLVGEGGRLATIEGDHVRTRTDGPTGPIRDLGSMGGALVAVGEWGRILRQRERGLEEVESPTEAGLAALIQVGEGRLIAVGDFGAMVDIRYDRASLIGTPTRASLRDGVSEGEAILVVGVEGTVLRGTMDALRASRLPDVGDLWAVVGTPADAIAVGDAGTIVRIREGGFTPVHCDVSVILRDVAQTPRGTWAVGDEGTVIRVEYGGCVVEHRGGPTLHAVGVGPDGGVIAAGDHGVVLARGDDGSWSEVGVDVSGASLRAVWRSDRYVYLAGTGGTVVRHPTLE